MAYADSLTERQRFDDAWRVLQTVTPVDDELIGRRARVAFWSGRYTLARPAARELAGAPSAWTRSAGGTLPRRRASCRTPTRVRGACDRTWRCGPTDQARPCGRPGCSRARGRWTRRSTSTGGRSQREPGRADLTRIVGYLLERRGDRAEAIRYYARAWELSEPRDADLALTIARLHRPQAPGDALIWYTRAGAAKVGSEERRQLQLELAQSEVAAGRLDQAAARIDEVLREQRVQRRRARDGRSTSKPPAATPAAAVRHLRRLSELRALTLDEQRWLAGQLLLAGDAAGALAEYERIVTSARCHRRGFRGRRRICAPRPATSPARSKPTPPRAAWARRRRPSWPWRDCWRRSGGSPTPSRPTRAT